MGLRTLRSRAGGQRFVDERTLGAFGMMTGMAIEEVANAPATAWRRR
jgi:hypothetical protein